MKKFLEIGCLGPEERDALVRSIEDAIAAKKKYGLFTDKDIREIEEMRLKPLPDILDVQSVHEDHLFRERK
jgi:hypothetical protein